MAPIRASARAVLRKGRFRRDLVLRFSDRILSIDLDVVDRWGKIAGSAAAKRSLLPVIDGLLAATALQYDLTLVTRNIADIAGFGVAVFDPWET